MALLTKTPRQKALSELKSLHFMTDPAVHNHMVKSLNEQRMDLLFRNTMVTSSRASKWFAGKLKRTFDVERVDQHLLFARREGIRKHVNDFFNAKIEQEQEIYCSNVKRMQDLIKENCLEREYEAIKNGRFNRFLLMYNRGYVQQFYLTGILTAMSGYVGGDLAARLVTGHPIDFMTTAALFTASLYYGWENPFVNDTIDAAIPIERPPENKKAENARAAFASEIYTQVKTKDNIGNAEKEVRKWGRVAAIFGLISPVWTVRHMMVMQAASGASAAAVLSVKTVMNGLKLWAGSTAAILGFERVIQGEIPLQYRHLTQATIVFFWQVAASLLSIRR